MDEKTANVIIRTIWETEEALTCASQQVEATRASITAATRRLDVLEELVASLLPEEE